MRLPEESLEFYKSNIREDKTIYLGLASNAKIKGLDEEYLKEGFTDPIFESRYAGLLSHHWREFIFEVSIYLGKIVFEGNNIAFKAFDVDENSFKGLKELYFKDKPDKTINDLELKKYFLKLYKDNAELLASYINEINQNRGIKFYYVEDSQYLEQDELAASLGKVIQTNDYEIVDFGDDLFYSYLIWSLEDFLIPYDTGLEQDKKNLFFNAAVYKIYDNDSMYKEASKTNYKNYDYLNNLFFSDIVSPLRYGIGYLQEEVERFGEDLKHSPGTRLTRIVSVLNKSYFSLEERPFEYVQSLERK
ncbi:hypothetical protein [Campylobacter helveticus]|uniref:DUF5644 domain-containing protein n=1 Tax=Campylobacter helveticus TaxID=28898 RepID=A0AAX2UHM2_9BACT|nr:hypothetical protein [Campylobacter helveticus]ARE80288.1 hypothetical protein CHELV3228_0674 [Campylobacter helveticus]MCR2040389.1 hypothetical protein [Campylobacter helveticus]MCR2055588.1 hypothetical protein [Campylobacter helveticus]MCR2057440.1 hypothetical protein [Campylobacter helveticus]MCR2063068.1 hypothetical protein [Campylobacter helveticus]